MKKQSVFALKYPVPKLSLCFEVQYAVIQYGQAFYRIKLND